MSHSGRSSRQGYRYLESKNRQCERASRKISSMTDAISKKNLEIKKLNHRIVELQDYVERLETTLQNQMGRLKIQERMIEDMGRKW